MPQNSFRNIGLRRDQNLGDLQNKLEGLTNLLNDFASGDDTYISDDLTSAVNTIRSYPVTQDEVIGLANITFQNTYYDFDLAAPVTAPAIPLVTVKNQFDRVKLEAGQDSYFGGSPFGLEAKFYDTSQLSTVSQGDADPIASLVGSEVPKDQKQFWMDGNFIWDNKINSAFENQQGAVIWDGYINPEGNGDLFVNIQTSGHLIIQIEDNNGAMQNIVWNDGPYYDFVVSTSSAGAKVISGGEGIMVDDRVVLYTNSGRTIEYFNGYTGGVDPSTDILNLGDFNADAAPATLYGRVFHPGTGYYGKSGKSKTIIIPGFLRFSPRRMKILWWLDESTIPVNKKFQLNLSVLLGTVINSNYFSTLNELPSQTPADFPEFKKFYVNRLGIDGGDIGTLSEPQSIITVGPIDTSDYIPPVNKAAVETIIQNGVVYRDSSPIVGQGIYEGLTLTAATGNLVLIGTSDSGRDCTLPTGTYITEMLPGAGFILNNPVGGTAVGVTNDLVTTFVDHRGLVDRVNITVAGTSVTITSSYLGADLIEGMLLITSTGRYDITQVTSATTFEAVTGATDGIAYIFKDGGILNYTTYNIVTVTDLTTLILDTVYGIEPGYYIKSIGKGGTNTLQEVATVDVNTNTITLVSNVTANLVQGDKIIGERANADTSAPFSATLTGLTTNTSHLIVENGKIRALDIELKNFINLSTEYSADGDETYFRLVDILVNDVNTQASVAYKIIATSI